MVAIIGCMEVRLIIKFCLFIDKMIKTMRILAKQGNNSDKLLWKIESKDLNTKESYLLKEQSNF